MANKYDVILGKYRQSDAPTGTEKRIPFFDSAQKLTDSSYLNWDDTTQSIFGGTGSPQSVIQFGSSFLQFNVVGSAKFYMGENVTASYVPFSCYDSANSPALGLDCYGNLKPFISFNGWESVVPEYNITDYGCYSTSWGRNTAAPDADLWILSKMIRVLIGGVDYWIPAYTSIYNNGGSGS